MSVEIKIDTRDYLRYREKIKALSTRAFPTAVRNTLNNAGFHMKKNELHKSAKEKFKYTRAKNFFKTFSYVNKAYGRNINTMKTKVGLRTLGKDSAKSAIQNMDMHEFGGAVNKGNAYLDSSRVSKSRSRFVRKKDYYVRSNILNNLKGSFTQRALQAHKEGKPFWHNKSGSNFLIKIDNVKKSKGKVKFKSRLIIKKRKNVRIRSNKFISVAAKKTANKIPEFYKIEFNKQLKRYVAR